MLQGVSDGGVQLVDVFFFKPFSVRRINYQYTFTSGGYELFHRLAKQLDILVQTGFPDRFTLIAKTSSGLEQVLAGELALLGAEGIEVLTRAVSFTADTRLMYKANYHLRTALRILKPLTEFRAKDEDKLYDQVRQTDWSQLLSVEKTFAIDAVVSGKYFTHSQYIALKTKDAIADQFREKFGARPSVSTTNPDLRINLHIQGDQCSLLLDSSGESLHKRGYRVVVDKAPINETLAAGLILLSGWKGETPENKGKSRINIGRTFSKNQ